MTRLILVFYMHNKVNILFIPSGGDLKKCALKMFPKVFTRKELEFFTQQDKKEQGRMSWIVKINNKGIKLGMITVTVKSNSWYGTGSSWTQSHDMHMSQHWQYANELKTKLMKTDNF